MMTEGSMEPERFAELLDAYGAEPRRWPEGERRAALEYLMMSREARTLRSRAAELDSMLDTVPSTMPSAALRERILRKAPGRHGIWQSRVAAGALAASLLLGIFAGTALHPPADDAEGGDFLQLAQLDDSYQDF